MVKPALQSTAQSITGDVEGLSFFKFDIVRIFMDNITDETILHFEAVYLHHVRKGSKILKNWTPKLSGGTCDPF